MRFVPGGRDRNLGQCLPEPGVMVWEPLFNSARHIRGVLFCLGSSRPELRDAYHLSLAVSGADKVPHTPAEHSSRQRRHMRDRSSRGIRLIFTPTIRNACSRPSSLTIFTVAPKRTSS